MSSGDYPFRVLIPGMAPVYCDDLAEARSAKGKHFNKSPVIQRKVIGGWEYFE